MSYLLSLIHAAQGSDDVLVSPLGSFSVVHLYTLPVLVSPSHESVLSVFVFPVSEIPSTACVQLILSITLPTEHKKILLINPMFAVGIVVCLNKAV